MSTSNIFNNYNKVLLKENYYNYLYNPSKKKSQRKIVISLANAIKNNDNNFDLNNEKHNDSLTTIDAMYNPYMLKLTEEEQSPFDNININIKSKNYILNEIKQRQRTAKIRPKSKAIDIQRYSDCVKITDNKKPNNYINAFSAAKFNINKKKLVIDADKKLKFKKKCPCCNNLLQIDKTKNKNNDKSEKLILDKHLNIYNNKNFKDSLSCFIFHINNFTSKETENKKEACIVRNDKIINYKTNMMSEFTKNLKKSKFKEIQRTEFDPSNLYLIQKPLIPTIRGKILRNMKKRYNRPIRNVVTSRSRPTSSSHYIDNLKKYIFKS
jgi:hypothetical protein